ncbi:hypothetical protein [Soonwooa sp.]|uniref:hypothetical protein n=1 Tax=Soonwooa sp. TaxID=1938592 RepID=UPI002605D421|nr:hypothetical protein [Soonwooa sp.]
MSYDIALYRIETKLQEEKSQDENFFENESNLVSFTEKQFQDLKERLENYEYNVVNQTDDQIKFSHPDEDLGTALLTKEALFFTASWKENSILEVGMTASEFTDTGEFAKYDFQNGAWEDLD